MEMGPAGLQLAPSGVAVEGSAAHGARDRRAGSRAPLRPGTDPLEHTPFAGRGGPRLPARGGDVAPRPHPRRPPRPGPHAARIGVSVRLLTPARGPITGTAPIPARH